MLMKNIRNKKLNSGNVQNLKIVNNKVKENIFYVKRGYFTCEKGILHITTLVISWINQICKAKTRPIHK